MTDLLDNITIEPNAKAQASVIWLHGLGADGNDFVPIVSQLGLPFDHVRFIFPHAPIIPVTMNFNMPMPAWFNLTELNRKGGIDIKGVKKSALAVQHIIEQQAQQGIPSERIVIAGFSQGGAISLYAGLQYPTKLAGIMALSTYIPHQDYYVITPHEANKTTPILFCHGRHDSLIPMHFAEESVADLRDAGHDVEWHQYPMEHSVCADEIQDISLWLQKVLK